MSFPEVFRMSVEFRGTHKRLTTVLTARGTGVPVRVDVPNEFGCGTMELTVIAQGIGFVRGTFTVGRESRYAVVSVPSRFFQFVFQLSVNPGRVQPGPKSEPVLFRQKDALVLGPGVRPTRLLVPEEDVDEICIFVDSAVIRSILKKYKCSVSKQFQNALENPVTSEWFCSGVTSHAMRESIRTLLSCEATDGFRTLCQEATINEIIALRLAQLGDGCAGEKPVFLMKHDLELLEQAHTFVLQKIDAAPTVEEISLMVGMNRTKLKSGFKKVYGTTIYCLGRIARLQKAYELLQDGTCNVGEVASRIGYRSPAAFSRAFRAQFGVNPLMVRATGTGRDAR